MAMPLYVSTTSDSGPGAKTRGGYNALEAVFTADTAGGRSQVTVRLVRNYDGTVRLVVDEDDVKDGFSVG